MTIKINHPIEGRRYYTIDVLYTKSCNTKKKDNQGYEREREKKTMINKYVDELLFCYIMSCFRLLS